MECSQIFDRPHCLRILRRQLKRFGKESTTRKGRGETHTRHETGRPSCVDCSDVGLMEAQKRGAKFSVHFKCHCEKGSDQEGRKLPRWSVEYSDNFEILKSWPDRIKYWKPTDEKPMSQLIAEYGARVKVSEDYWDYNGFEKEDPNDGISEER